jgi:hypothetical protein
MTVFRRVVPFAVAIVLAAGVAGGAVYGWQRGVVRERERALADAVQARDEAVGETERLQGDLEDRTTEADALRSEVAQLRAQIERLRRCDPAAMLDAIRAEIQIPVQGVFWGSVDVQECRGRYARVFVHVEGTPPPGTSLEDSEQVFLRYSGGAWAVLTSGTGVTCDESSFAVVPELEDACAVLGLT